MRSRILWALLVAAPTTAAAQPVGLAAARVIDGAGHVTTDGFVVVDSGRIVRVGTRPAGFRGTVYDLGDATLMPGLIDVHVHVDWHFNATGRLHTGDDGETPAQGALAAAANAYRMLMADSLGTLAPGRVADVVAVTGNPLEDIERMREVVFVMKGGRIYRNERSGTVP